MRIALPLSPSQQIYAAFAFYAFAMGNIFPRLGDVQLAMGVDKSALGLGLIGTPIGTLVSFTFLAPLLERIGHRLVLFGGIPLIALLFAIAVHAPSPFVLFFLLFPVGLTIGCVEIILNIEADRAENAVGYRIMNRCHAFWSIGFFSAGFFGAWLASLGISPQLHLGIVVPLSVIGVVLSLSNFVPAAKRSGESVDAGPHFSLPSFAIMLLFCVTASAMLLEGASMDWSAIYMRDAFMAGPFLAGIGVAAFAICQASARFLVDGFVDKHSPASVARVLQAILFLGCAMVFLSPAPVISLLGFALMGIGTSAIFPLAMSAAAQRTDRPSTINVASLAQISFTMFLMGPPLLGFVADHWGIRSSFGIALPIIILGLLTSGSLGRK